ncbi:nicotinate phosphoribosyltransferase (NAPRTase) family domain-containing protein [Ditylenchus destructor]|uniref:Nicotinamide phosphoribosyltransferase n=1 Tax=Ditylenchus destructor TaxID=166010 RepID=A0AAD4MME8_9BILA|nr:nicotinate phosphoribosyltransferase (NAPRTase) family domain-containing protein [Ditylenchus destructor]
MDLNAVENILFATDSYKVTLHEVHFGGMDVFNEKGWMHIVEAHNGYLPLRIKAVPEGTVVPVRNVLFTIENTDPQVPWFVSWVETLLVQVWYPMTMATSSRTQKEVIARGLLDTSDSLDGLLFKLHDFGFRGCSSVEARNLCCFVGLVSVVSDSYDVFHAVSSIWGDELKAYVLERAEKGCLVIRPDSGDPCEVVVKVLNLLAEKYPITTNSKGYRVLPPYLRVMQGDWISLESLQQIIDAMKIEGWSLQNVIFGTGGALLQKLDRDTQKCAYKCSQVTINGESHDVCKNPTTDAGKRSKKGRLVLEKRADRNYVTVQEGLGDEKKDELVCVFENGRLLVDHTLDQIRERAELPIVREFNQSRMKMNGLETRRTVETRIESFLYNLYVSFIL